LDPEGSDLINALMDSEYDSILLGAGKKVRGETSLEEIDH
jgi:hypothetical protein